jgi:hypothetical protein
MFPALWAGLLLGGVTIGLTKFFPYKYKTITILCLTPAIFLLFFHSQAVKKYIKGDLAVGAYRKTILETVAQVGPALSNNTIWYFFTNNNGFYEYQSGTGQMLSVWLYDTGKIPKEALIDSNFWDPGYEGVKKLSTGIYGYFMTKQKLLSYLKNNPDTDLNIIQAYYWDQQLHSVKNVSLDIRKELAVELRK